MTAALGKSAPSQAAAAAAQQPEPAPKPILVFFFSRLSGSSRRVEGYLAQVLQRRSNHDTFTLHRVESERRPDLVERLRVEELPTILVIEQKRVRARLERPRGCAQITEVLAPWLK
jgi:thioredoxin-like negative regulator of GroEL